MLRLWISNFYWHEKITSYRHIISIVIHNQAWQKRFYSQLSVELSHRRHSFFREMWSWNLEGCKVRCKNSIIPLPWIWFSTNIENCYIGKTGGECKVLWGQKEFPVPHPLFIFSPIWLRVFLPGKWVGNFQNSCSSEWLRS